MVSVLIWQQKGVQGSSGALWQMFSQLALLWNFGDTNILNPLISNCVYSNDVTGPFWNEVKSWCSGVHVLRQPWSLQWMISDVAKGSRSISTSGHCRERKENGSQLADDLRLSCCGYQCVRDLIYSKPSKLCPSGNGIRVRSKKSKRLKRKQIS